MTEYYYFIHLFTLINQRAISRIECFANNITVRYMSDSENSVVYLKNIYVFSFSTICNFTLTFVPIDYWLQVLITDYWLLNTWPGISWRCKIGSAMGPGCLDLLLQQLGQDYHPRRKTRWERPLAYLENTSLETNPRSNNTLPPRALKLTPKTNQRSHFPCFLLSRFFYAGLVQIQIHPDHWRMRVGTQPPGDNFSAVGMWMTCTYLYAKYVVIL